MITEIKPEFITLIEDTRDGKIVCCWKSYEDDFEKAKEFAVRVMEGMPPVYKITVKRYIK